LILPPEDNDDELAEQNVVDSPDHVANADGLQIVLYEAGFQQHEDGNVDNAMNINVWLFFTLCFLFSVNNFVVLFFIQC
jgi:hypothetical protein